jgi:hypothetical protein
MAGWSDLHGAMAFPPLNDATIEALLEGRLHPDDVPPALHHLAATVQAAKAPGQAAELASQHQVVSAMVATLKTAGKASVGTHAARTAAASGRKTMLGKLLTMKAAAAALGTAVVAGGAAAAAGALPGPLQQAMASAGKVVGLSLPSGTGSSGTGSSGGASAGSGTTSSTGTTSGTSSSGRTVGGAVGPTVGGPATFGLCTAYLASHSSSGSTTASSGASTTTGSGSGSSTGTGTSSGGTSTTGTGTSSGGTSTTGTGSSQPVAFANLAQAAAARGESVTGYCEAVVATHPGEDRGAGNGASSNPSTSHDQAGGQATEGTDHGQPSQNPSAGVGQGADGRGGAATGSGGAPGGTASTAQGSGVSGDGHVTGSAGSSGGPGVAGAGPGEGASHRGGN